MRPGVASNAARLVVLRFAGQRVPAHRLGRKVVEVADASEVALETALASVASSFGTPSGIVSILGLDEDAQRGALFSLLRSLH